ncbi:unnamed protein product [Clonostachys rosea f. rosea IK726]|uniref:Uncharacterized protein n=1 Tax=Clonostachys rosea f. rosea IK726 TaxID=1349383 RepID=A0ACA9UF13_BIOOC|nr:unnamed protein product [Clonostachys rosea f. rosea IK726]
MSLPILPIELVSRIIGSLQRPHQVRAVCRQWNSLAIKHAFHTATLVPTEAGCRKWNAIMDTSQLKTAIRTVVIYSHDPDTVEHNGFDWCEDEEDDNYTPFKEAVSRLRELDLVSKVSIKFSEESYGAQDGYCEVETKEAREKTLITVFEAIKTRAEEKPDKTTIHALSLKNLQNFPLRDFTSSELFKAVTKDIDELHLDIKEEHNSHGPDHDIYLPELVEFMPYLQEHWLAPLSGQLTTLSLYFTEFWGTMPGTFHGHGLDFPRLQTLNLGQLAISHHDHLDWVLRQKALKTLRFERCVICPYIRTESDKIGEWGIPTDDWEELPRGSFGFDMDDDAIYYFPGTWESVFDKIRTNLPHLVDFQFRWASWTPVMFDDQRHMGTDLSSSRYLVFDIGLLPSRWIEAENEGVLSFGDALDDDDSETGEPKELNRHKETLAGDQRAFEELLKATYQRQ